MPDVIIGIVHVIEADIVLRQCWKSRNNSAMLLTVLIIGNVHADKNPIMDKLMKIQ